MTNRVYIPLLLTSCALASGRTALAQEKVNYQDHVLPVFRNACLNCHNADKKKAGLDLSSYSAMMAGSNSGKVIEPGDPGGSLLYRLVTHSEEPAMPPKGDKLSDRELESIKKWIAGGVLESSGSTAVVSDKPKVDLKIDASAGKPDGPPPMPGELLLDPPVHTKRPGAVLAMASSPWAPLVALGGQKQVLLYNPQSRDLLGVIPFPEGFPNVIKFSRSGKLLLVAGGVGARSGKAVLFDVATGNRVTEVGDELDAVLAADISPDQSLVALGGSGKVVKVYSTASGAMVAKIKKHTDWITAIAFSPDGVLLATGDRNGGLVVWEADSANEFYVLPGHKAAVTDAVFRGDSNLLASSGEDGDVKLWDMASGKQAKSFPAHAGGALSVDFAPDGRLVTAGRDRRVRLWKPDGSPLKDDQEFADIALHACFDNSGGGKLVIGADYRGEVRVFSAEGKSPPAALAVNPPPIADRLAEASAKLAELQAAADKVAGEYASAQAQLAEAASEMRETEASLPQLRKSLEEAENDAAEANEARERAQAALEAGPAAVAAKRAEAAQLAGASAQARTLRDMLDSWHAGLSEDVSAKQAACSAAVADAARAKEAAQLAPTDAARAKAAADAARRAADAARALQDSQQAFGEVSVHVAASSQACLRADTLAAPGAQALAAAEQSTQRARAELDRAASNSRAASEAVADARDALTTAQQNLPKAAERVAALTAAAEKLKPLAEQAAAELEPTKRQVARLQAGQFFTQVYAARQELRAAQLEADAAGAAAKAAQAASERAVADVPAFEKRMREFDQTIAAAERAVPVAQQTATAALNMAKAMDALAAEREAFVKQSAEHAAKVAELAANDPQSKLLAEAAEAAKGVPGLLAADLEKFRENVKTRHQAAKEEQIAADAARAALERERFEQKNAPQTLDALRAAIPLAREAAAAATRNAETAAQKLNEAKAKAEQLDTQYADLKKRLGVAAQG